MPSYDLALHALRTLLDSRTGIGHVVVGMHRQRSRVYTADLEAAFATLTKERVQALIALADLQLTEHVSTIAGLATSRRLPLMGFGPRWSEAGALLSYGAVFGTQPEYSRQAAAYVVKILHGAKPAELPVQQPTKFELIINLKTAKALGLTIPQTLLLQADRVIE